MIPTFLRGRVFLFLFTVRFENKVKRGSSLNYSELLIKSLPIFKK